MRAMVMLGTPRNQAARTMMQEATPPRISPTPGMSPTMPSIPKRNEVPGMRNQSSRTWERRSRF